MGQFPAQRTDTVPDALVKQFAALIDVLIIGDDSSHGTVKLPVKNLQIQFETLYLKMHQRAFVARYSL